MANQYDPLVIKSGLAGVLGTDTLRADVIAHAGLTTTGLAAGDVVQVTANLTLSKAVNTSTSPIVGVYDGVSGSVVREGVVVATFKGGLTLANGDAVYLSSTAGALTNVKPTADMLHEVGVVVDAASSRVLLQQKPVIALPASPPPYLWTVARGVVPAYGFVQLKVSDGSLVSRAQIGLDYGGNEASLLYDGKGNVWGARRLPGTDSLIKIDANTGARLGGMDKGTSSSNGTLQIAFDGTNYWYTNYTGTYLHCIDVNLNPVRDVSITTGIDSLIYDGVGNIWVWYSAYLAKIRASDGANLGEINPNKTSPYTFFISDKTNVWVHKYEWNGGGTGVRYYLRKILISSMAVTSYGPFSGAPRGATRDASYLYVLTYRDSYDSDSTMYVDKIRLSDGVRETSYFMGDPFWAYHIFFDGTNLWLSPSNSGRFRKMTTNGVVLGNNYPPEDILGDCPGVAFTNIVLPWP